MRNMAKRAISLLCVISMLLSMMITVQAAGVGIAVENITLQQGSGTETVEVPIKISDNTGILGMTLQVAYDEGLTLTGVAKGDALSSLTFTKPGNFSANPVNLVWDGESDADTANGVIATLTFTVSKDTVKDYHIDITTKGVFDDNLDDVIVATTNGKISVVGNEPIEPDEPVTGTTITAPEKTVNQGTGTETVEVPITIAGNTGILGMTLTVEYGDGLTLTNVVKGDALSSLTFTKPGNFSANPVNLVWDGESDADAANGVIATLTFTVPKGTAKEYPITLTTKGVFDDNLDDVVVTTVNGKISVGSGEVEEPVTGTTITAPEKTVNQGTGTETIEVPISIAGNTGILGMTLTVAYGEGLTLTNVVKGEALSSLTFTKPGNFSANPVNLVWDGESDADTANGVIATLTFTVPKGTAKEYPIILTTKGVFDDNLDDVTVTTKAGKIIVVGQAHTHEYGKWTKIDDTNHKKVCGCGDEIVATHSWNNGVVTTQPTHTKEGVKTYTCSDCNATKTETVAKTTEHSYGNWEKADDTNHKKTCECGDVVTEAHKWDAGQVTTAATHTTAGVKTYTCTVCKATKAESIPADVDNHTFGKWAEKDANSHERECECGKTETADHNWNDGVVTTEPTHMEAGVKTYTCSDCKATKIEKIPAKFDDHSYGDWEKADDTNHKKTCECGDVVTEAHKWDEGQVTTAATHTTAGVKTYTCTVCKATKTESIPADVDNHTFGKWAKKDANRHERECACGKTETADHIWNDGVVTTQPTHIKEGIKTFTCADCGATKTEAVAKLEGHTYGDWVKADDTNHKKTCECGDIVTEAHKWDEGKITTAATHTKEGVKTFTCVDCGATKTEAVAKLEGHTYGNWVKADDTNHKKTCECGDVVTEAHKWDAGQVTTAATHTTAGVKTYTCTVCKATKAESIPADVDNHTFGKWAEKDANSHERECECGKTETADHNWNDGVVTTQPTHLAEGVKTFTCADCGATKTESVAKLEGHTYGEWEKADAENHKKSCECGDVVTEAHKWDDGQVTTAATHTKDGVKTYTCTVCKATKTESIPADADNHTFSKWTKVDDNMHSRECECGKTETADHGWNDGVVTTQPTHTKEGIKTFTCADCGATKTEILEKIAHSYSEWTNLTETLHKRECTCGNVQTEEHKWDEGVVTTDATHTSYGVKTYTCSVCKTTKTEKIDKLSGHTYGEWTKRDDNSHLRECACSMIEVSAHKWNAGEVTTEPTHTKEGAKTYTCSDCKATKVEKLDKIPGHSFGDWTKVDNNNHKRTCECGVEEIAAHTWNEGEVTKEPTESTTGTRVHTCSACSGTKTEELSVLTHKHTLNKTKAKAATCTEAGNIEYYTCSGCNKKFKNANGKEEVQNVEIAALGHSAGQFVAKVEPTCNKNGRLAYYECANAGCRVKFADAQATIKLTNLTIPKAHVSLVEIPGFEATCTHVGLSTGQKCTACNVVIAKQAVIPKLSHSLTEVAEIPATCEADGTKGYYNCSGCGKKFTNASATQEITELVIPALGHNYGAWEITTPAGPGVNGEKTRVCQNNGNHIETAVIPALDGVCANANNHSAAEYKVKVEATCTSNGLKQRYCDTCGEFVGETVELPAAHQLEDVSATPNCLVDGIKAHKHCSVCGKNFINGTEVNSVVAPAKGEHTWSEYVNDVATCTVCGETKKFIYTTTTDAKLDVEDFESAITETDNSLIDAGLSVNHEMNVEDIETPSVELTEELENKGFDTHEKFIVDITIDKHVTNGSTISYKEEIRETEELMSIEFTLPSNLRNKLNYFMLRVHEGIADEITTTPNAHGEYIVLDLVNHKLTMYVRFFSEYAIFADGEATTPSTPHYGGSSVSRYTVKFESNGGSNVKSATVARNAVVAEPTAPTKEGFKFDGWYTDKELTRKFDFTTKVTKNITLYAKWIEIKEDGESTEDKWFVDVEESDWYYASVKYVVDNNLMNGVSDSEFAPNDTLTRAMLVTVLYRNEGELATNRSIPFADVDMGSYYGNAVSWAKQNGIVSGVTENSFAPDTNITREQIATIMFRYAQYKGMNAVTLEENLHFTDSSEISEYAVSAMNWAVGTGLMKGKSTTTINPLDNATRAEIAAILQRFIEANK